MTQSWSCWQGVKASCLRHASCAVFQSCKPHAFSLADWYCCCRAAAEDAEFQARLELIKAEAAQKKAAGVSHTRRQQQQKKPAASFDCRLPQLQCWSFIRPLLTPQMSVADARQARDSLVQGRRLTVVTALVQHSLHNQGCCCCCCSCAASLSFCAAYLCLSMLRLPLLLRRHPAVAAAPHVLCSMPHLSRRTSMRTHPHS